MARGRSGRIHPRFHDSTLYVHIKDTDCHFERQGPGILAEPHHVGDPRTGWELKLERGAAGTSILRRLEVFRSTRRYEGHALRRVVKIPA